MSFSSPPRSPKRRSQRSPLRPGVDRQREWSAHFPAGKLSPAIFKAQVWLDRAGFSPGEIDAHGGENFDKALRAYQQGNGLEPTGKLDEATWNALANSSSDATVRNYTIAAGDVERPFRQTNSEAVLGHGKA